MTFSLRPYQSDLISNTRDELRRHRSVLIQAPTGSGKTALAADMIARTAERGKRAWFVCHRDFLLTQTAAAMDAVGVKYGYIAANREMSPHAVQICSIDTLRRRTGNLVPPDLIVWDECHHIAARTWGVVAKWASISRHVGLSATPARLDGRGLGAFFGAMVRGPSVAWLIERGFLSRYRAYAPGTPNLAGVRSRAGDYAQGELAEVMDTSQIAGNIVNQWQLLAAGKRSIYYGVSVSHSQHMAAAFQARGIPARHLDAEDTLTARADAAVALSDRAISIITNCELFSEGFDLASLAPGAGIECVGLCRPTQSLTIHLQQIGRALRPKSEPAIILDHAGNLMRHGLPDDEREWSLAGIDRKTRDKDLGPPVRQCPSCYGVYSASQRACPYCGAAPVLSPREVEEIDAELLEVDRSLLAAAKQREVQRARTLEALIEVGRQRGYRAGWARHVWRGRQSRQLARQPETIQS